MNSPELLLDIELPRDSTCARRARSAVLEILDGDPRADSVELIVSELVTNAFVHSSGDIHLSLMTVGERLRVEVSSDTEQTDFEVAPQQQSLDSERGRGLALVHSMSTEVGHVLGDTRLTIWAEVS